MFSFISLSKILVAILCINFYLFRFCTNYNNVNFLFLQHITMYILNIKNVLKMLCSDWSGHSTLRHQFDMRGLINIQSDDNEYFGWSIFRYLNPVDQNPAIVKRFDRDFAKKILILKA